MRPPALRTANLAHFFHANDQRTARHTTRPRFAPP
ncbi:MAG: hypothetical protein ACI91B_003612, partial [Planctomycetota bacterium]